MEMFLSRSEVVATFDRLLGATVVELKNTDDTAVGTRSHIDTHRSATALLRRRHRVGRARRFVRHRLRHAPDGWGAWIASACRMPPISVLFPLTDTESDSAHGVNQPDEVGTVDLAAQPRDVNVDDIVERCCALDVLPKFVRQHFARDG